MPFVLLILYLLIATAYSACSAPTPYLLAFNNSCYAECPWNPPQQYYASPLDSTCVKVCPPTWYGFDGKKECVQICPATPNITFYDTINSKCVGVCPANYFSYLGSHADNQKCVLDCPAGTFAQQTKRQCVSSCPANTFYKNDSTPFCVIRCPDNYYASPIDKNCKIGGSCPTLPVRHFADDITNMCVQNCPANTFSDSSTGRCLVYCSDGYFADKTTWKCVQICPSSYYRDNVTRSCLLKCTEGYFIDRQTLNCTQICTTGTFGDFATTYCQQQCTNNTFSDSVIGRCISVCSFGTYADDFTQNCVIQTACHSNWIGNPTTRKCVQSSNCPVNPYHYANLAAKKCTPKCPNPLWGDKSTKSCVSNCPWNPKTYVTWKNPDTQECVTTCPQFPILYADNSTRTCVSQCPAQSSTLAYDTFADDLSQSCVRVCPNGFKAQKPKYVCVSQCSNNPTLLYFYHVNSSCITQCPQGYFSDNSRQLCSQKCPSNPDFYALDSNNSCVSECPAGLYADPSTRICVQWCPQTTFQYADNSTNKCVTVCPIAPDYFGLDRIDGNRVCVGTCQVRLFADSLSRTCLAQCNIQKGYYGQLLNPLRRCVLKCPSSSFADNTTKMCVPKCPNTPLRYYGNALTRKCQLKCPQFLYANSVTNLCGQPADCQTGFYADDLANKCVKICPITQQTYGQLSTRRCLKRCYQGTFADNTTRRCENVCNATAKLYKDFSTNRCVKTCPTVPNLYNNPFTMTCDQRCSNNWFAYDELRKCVQICPSTPALYGNIDTRRCVQTCPQEKYKFVTNTQRQCLPYCPVSYLGDLYADNTTWSCVSVCPKASNIYSFKHPDDLTVRKCVLTCPMVNGTVYYFADNITQACVTTCPLKKLTWGDKFTLKCQKNCSRQQYRDNGTVRCTYSCSVPYFADNTTWDCVKQCPNGTFAYASGTNRTCLKQCPTGSYADKKTKYCRSLCDHDVALWSDNTTWECVNKCPSAPDLYADPNTDKCQFACSGGLFADKDNRKCVSALKCSNSTIGDLTTYRCINKCPIQVPSFWQISSNTCVLICQDGYYADNSTMKCVQTCPAFPDYYAYNHPILGPVCVLYCPALYYKHLLNRTCLTLCPGLEYFRDSTTMKCVKQCPDHLYAQIIDQVCVANCSINSKYGLDSICYSSCTGQYNMDPTTYLCVKVCPFRYFSESNLCRQGCSIGYADSITRKCQPNLCSAGYYSQTGTHLCVQDCQPQYRYDFNQTCIPLCPRTSAHATDLYMDNSSYMCTNYCLPGQYADNITGYCSSDCSITLFADNSTGRCVNKCPSTPDYYGYQKFCYTTCPNAGLYAENQTRECLSVCPPGSFADNYNQRCMDVCTLKQYSHTYIQLTVAYSVCVQVCPQEFYALDITKTCVPICPEGTYGENVTNKCIQKCPTGTYADQFLNLCVLDCDLGREQFQEWSTRKCVKVCPAVPSLYAQNSSRSCVSFCQPSWYGLNTTRICRQICPAPFYADPTTGFCESKCHVGTDRFADNVSRQCVVNCPNYTEPVTNKFIITYEDNSTKTCVKQCPFFPSLYGYNQTNACVEDCPSGTFGDNDTRLCMDKCFFNIAVNGVKKFTYADPTTGFCLNQCPKNYFADNQTVTCTQLCSEGTFADNSTWRCVHMCPTNPISFARSSTRQCVYRCDIGYFGDQLSRQCLKYCPKQPYYYYKDYQNQRCVKNCTTSDNQYFSEDLSQSCVTQCTIGYFKSLSRHACVKCPTSCSTCVAQLNCTSCRAQLYLYEGQCISSCPTLPLRYYANDLSSSCVLECPRPYFGFIGTGKCQLNCPQKYFNDVTDNTCKNCTEGCRKCINRNVCLDCLVGYVHVPQYNTCSKICNKTHIFFVQGKCFQKCIDGTFLLNDLVTCQKCSTQCATCSASGNNCTKCASKFWYNYNCVDQCPKNFYSDSNNKCLDCNKNIAACAVQPLRFTIQTFTKQYKLFAYVRFNRAVNLSISQFNKIVSIRTSKGPIKSGSYKASVYDSRTFLIQFLDSTSLNQMSLSINFAPGSIVDQHGNGLVDSSKQSPIQTLETISIQTKQTAVQMKSNVKILSWILIILLVAMMIKCTYPLIVLIDFLQLLYLHLYIEIKPLPYLWMQVISALQNVNFSFLPIISSQIDQTRSNPFYYFKSDITFIGNMQPVIFIGSLFSITYLIFWAITKSNISLFRGLRKSIRKVFKNRMKYSFFNEVFYYTQVYVFFFAVLQWSKNRSTENSVTNLSLSIIFAGMYVGWLIFLLYKSSHYRNNISKMPKRFKFLVMEPTRFPMDIAVRYLLKLWFCLSLLIPQKSVQIILLIVINLVYFLFNLIYKPAIQPKTNYMNMFVCLGFITYEILLFVYGTGEKSSSSQYKWSVALLIVAGLVLGVILVWMLYRLVSHIKVQWLGIGNTKPQQVYCENRKTQNDKQIQDYNQNVFSFFTWNQFNTSKRTENPPNSDYNKLSFMSRSVLDQDQKTVKNMLSQLQFNDKSEAADDDSEPQIDEDDIINEFAYHMVPKKHESLIKTQRQILARNQSKKGNTFKGKRTKRGAFPMIISIDQDELIQNNLQIIDNSSPRAHQKESSRTEQKVVRPKVEQTKQPKNKNMSVIWNEHLPNDDI